MYVCVCVCPSVYLSVSLSTVLMFLKFSLLFSLPHSGKICFFSEKNYDCECFVKLHFQSVNHIIRLCANDLPPMIFHKHLVWICSPGQAKLFVLPWLRHAWFHDHVLDSVLSSGNSMCRYKICVLYCSLEISKIS